MGRPVVQLATETLTALAEGGRADRAVVVGFRPGSVDLVTENDPEAFHRHRPAVVEELGSDAFLHGWHSDLPGSDHDREWTDHRPGRPEPHARQGLAMSCHLLRIQPGKGHFFSVTTSSAATQLKGPHMQPLERDIVAVTAPHQMSIPT